jgi:tetratricopeptide (TPR) repeat protein
MNFFLMCRTLLIAWAVLLVMGCASTGRRSTASRAVPAQAYWHFVNADLLELGGYSEAALEEYLEALKLDSLWMMLGDCYNRLSKVKEAERAYKRVLELNSPEVLQAHHRLALIEEYRGRPKEALRHYDEMLPLISHPEEIHLRRAALLAGMGQMDKALEEYGRALAARGDLVEAHVGISRIHETMGQPEKAIAQYERAIDLLPVHSLRLRFLLADLLIRESRPEEAAAQLHIILQEDPQNSLALRQLANLLYAGDRLDEAREVLESLRPLLPDDPWVPLSLARVLARQGDAQGAIPLFREAISLDESVVQGWLGLGAALMQRGEYGQAGDELERAIQVLPEKPLLHHLLGVCYLRRQMYPQAIEALQRSLSLAPENIGVMRDLATGYERAGFFDEAVALLEQVLERDADDHWALNYLGYMLADRGVQLEQAQEFIERALEMEPENAAYLDSMGWICYRLGKLPLAEEYLVKAIAESGDEAVMYDHLGDVYLRQGRQAEAVEQWRKALELNPDDQTIREKLE